MLDALGSSLTSSICLWRGTQAYYPARRQPEKLLELYDFEACPFCRLVREALTELDLDALIHPCPKGGTRHRPRVDELGGKQQYPFLVDPNTGHRLYESADIIAYLFETYGDGRLPARWRPHLLNEATSVAGGVLRGTAGSRARPSREAKKPLLLYSFESSPFSRPVREKLCELELTYELRNVGKYKWTDWIIPAVRNNFMPGYRVLGRNRAELLERGGRMQVPYLVDPNTGVEMYESTDIVEYLETTYAV